MWRLRDRELGFHGNLSPRLPPPLKVTTGLPARSPPPSGQQRMLACSHTNVVLLGCSRASTRKPLGPTKATPTAP